MMRRRRRDGQTRAPRSLIISLKSAGMLSALIFLINTIYEVLVFNHLHVSQRFLLGWLLTILALWAWLEISLPSRQQPAIALHNLNISLVIQLGVILLRHWHELSLNPPLTEELQSVTSSSLLEQLIPLSGLYIVLFMAIAQCLINAFSHAERMAVDELRRQMQLLGTTQQQLEISEARYRNFFNLPLVGAAILSTDKSWVAVNQTLCTMLGYRQDELFLVDWDMLSDPNDAPGDHVSFHRMMHNEIDGFQAEKRFIRKDGTVIHTLLAYGCARDHHQMPTLLYVNLIDITRRKQIESELESSRQREKSTEIQQRTLLEQKLKTSLTAAAVVHEIQQPLSSILLNSNLALERLKNLPDALIGEDMIGQLAHLKEDAMLVTITMERMRMLLRNVQTEPQPIELTTILDSALSFLKRELTSMLVTLQIDAFDRPCPMLGDAAQLQTAVVNLVRNALQAMESQSPDTRRLQIELRHHADHLDIVVADSGPGFPEECCGSSPGWEVLRSTKASGMGIGLFLAQTAAVNHHGQLHIGHSADLGGAEVVIALPPLRHGDASGPRAEHAVGEASRLP